MNDNADVLDAAVVGAGWAGLGVSYWLARKGLRHTVLERGHIGETWRTQRWDAFHMNSPNVQTVMPGDRYEGKDPEGVLTRDRFVALLEDFAGRNGLPVETDTAVSELVQENGTYRLNTSHGALRARNVILASGNLNRAVRPVSSDALPPDIHQIDASGYRCAADLPGGRCWLSEAVNQARRSRRNWGKRAERSSSRPAASGGSQGVIAGATS
ncbi:NAD(P)-binding domain-containing protein [Candidatus Phyllobacterium onerii]|uniref:NAD(P)-binding domain-containing protein n=1 Tax=Candidatus Phyllobacterium onerii TaxID=3020828 RepID=UPI002FEDED14